MIQAETLVTLLVTPDGASGHKRYTRQLLVEGDPLTPPQPVAPARFQTLHFASDLLRAHFLRPGQPQLAAEAAHAVGVELAAVWLEGLWEPLQGRLAAGRPALLSVASPDLEILNLPWELLLPPGEETPLGLHPRWGVRRLAADSGEPIRCCVVLPPPPLKLLHVACTPADRPPLSRSAEVHGLLTAMDLAGGELMVERTRSGTLAELHQAIQRFQPQILHLTGHALVRNGAGYFCFEDEHGAADIRRGAELAREVLAGTPVQLLLVSGREPGHPPPVAAVGAFCREAVGDHLPLALALPESLNDPRAVAFVGQWLGELAAGRPLDQALAEARRAARNDPGADPFWILPVLYGTTVQRLLFNTSPAAVRVLPDPCVLPVTPPITLAGGHCSHFADRRRVFQSLLPDLVRGTLAGALIHGPAGCGKTALGWQLAGCLARDDRPVVVVAGTAELPITPFRVVERCAMAFREAGHEDHYQTIKSGVLPAPERLQQLATLLAAHPFTLLLDGLDSALDPLTGGVADPQLAAFLRTFLDQADNASRLLITCRTPLKLSGVRRPGRLAQQAIGPLSPPYWRELLLRDREVAGRWQWRDLAPDTFDVIAHLAQDHVALLHQIGTSLRTLETPLAEATPAEQGGDPAHHLAQRFVAPLWNALPPACRLPLARCALAAIPLDARDVAALAEIPLPQAEVCLAAWEEQGLALPVTPAATPAMAEGRHDPLAWWQPLPAPPAAAHGPRWWIPPHLREWLSAPPRLPHGIRRPAQRTAAHYLEGVFDENREAEWSLTWSELLVLVRHHLLAAGETARARLLSRQLSDTWTEHGFHPLVERFNREQHVAEPHPESLLRVAQSLLHQHRLEDAEHHYRELLGLVQGRDRGMESLALNGLAAIASARDDLTGARGLVERAVGLLRGIDNPAGLAEALESLADLELQLDSADRAGEHLLEARALHQQGHRPREAARLCHRLAALRLDQGQPATALQALSEALELERRQGDQGVVAETLAFMGTLLARQGEQQTARKRLLESLELLPAHSATRALVLHELGNLALAREWLEEAAGRFRLALAIRRRRGDAKGLAATCLQLGRLAWQAGIPREGLPLVALAGQLDHRLQLPQAAQELQLLAMMVEQLGLPPEEMERLLIAAGQAYARDQGESLAEAVLRRVEGRE